MFNDFSWNLYRQYRRALVEISVVCRLAFIALQHAGSAQNPLSHLTDMSQSMKLSPQEALLKDDSALYRIISGDLPMSCHLRYLSLLSDFGRILKVTATSQKIQSCRRSTVFSQTHLLRLQLIACHPGQDDALGLIYMQRVPTFRPAKISRRICMAGKYRNLYRGTPWRCGGGDTDIHDR
ncbi:hypothetical protein CPB85DRAFT_328639 [Mucidula mucida]|nr:hypothetical protein CPB85DRAFT_328639 [Mucidula mucida]